jgi:NADPH:quinone reductase-like Zn-dependent oxidoreductase
MKAVIQSAYGGPEVYSIGEVPVPEPRADDVRVQIRAASLHPDIWHVMTGRPHVLRVMGAGVVRPKQPIPGTDLAGIVDATGPLVTRFQKGDRVFGESVIGIQWQNGGTFAEYICIRQSALAMMPEQASFEEAAALPTAGFIALQVVRGEGRVSRGQRVLINGAGGGVGTLALQMARAFGAEVTAVDDVSKHPMLLELGATRCIDYRQQDYTNGEARYDVIIDVPCNHPFARNRRVLAPEGFYVMVGHDSFGATRGRWLGSIPYALGLMLRSLWNRQLPGVSGALPAPDRLETLRTFLESGQVRPRIGRTFALTEVRQAMTTMIQGETIGRIVLIV